MRAWVHANGLTLHPDKTHVGDCRVAGQGFEFLGYRFEAGQRWVRKKSLMSLHDKIRAKTKPSVGRSIACVIASLNPTLQGWYGWALHAKGKADPANRFYALDDKIHRMTIPRLRECRSINKLV